MTEASPARANMGYVGAIVAVATIGGFLFGYDSGAVNGTQDGLRSTLGLDDAGLGFTVGSLVNRVNSAAISQPSPRPTDRRNRAFHPRAATVASPTDRTLTGLWPCGPWREQ